MPTIQEYFNNNYGSEVKAIHLTGNQITRDLTGSELTVENFPQLKTLSIKGLPQLKKLIIKGENTQQLSKIESEIDQVVLMGGDNNQIAIINTEKNHSNPNNNSPILWQGLAGIFLLIAIFSISYIFYLVKKRNAISPVPPHFRG
ncbi:9568_t:CDS:1 [Ambispora gerdemannii]|uniref:9568_t:CDS:1 n=1 Tax=Ambispora gerdemannii TaxID=144530 RepID=A0A9N9DLA1_9GLOM|nr:9568_t:CDS:1 [Ambispora gerdemannii]